MSQTDPVLKPLNELVANVNASIEKYSTAENQNPLETLDVLQTLVWVSLQVSEILATYDYSRPDRDKTIIKTCIEIINVIDEQYKREIARQGQDPQRRQRLKTLHKLKPPIRNEKKRDDSPR